MDLSTQPLGSTLIDLFRSHRGLNAGPAISLAERLEQETLPDGRNLRVFLDEFDILPGHGIVGRVSWGLANARYVGLLLTPRLLRISEWLGRC
jgi:hypothetical protein